MGLLEEIEFKNVVTELLNLYWSDVSSNSYCENCENVLSKQLSEFQI